MFIFHFCSEYVFFYNYNIIKSGVFIIVYSVYYLIMRSSVRKCDENNKNKDDT